MHEKGWTTIQAFTVHTLEHQSMHEYGSLLYLKAVFNVVTSWI